MTKLIKPVLPILVVAVLLRLLIMPFFFHPDIKEHYYHGSFLQNGVTDIYSYIQDNQSQLVYKVSFNYYPAFYFFVGGYQAVVSPIFGGDFKSWLEDGSQSMVSQVGVYRYLFLMKVPYLIVDLLIGLGLMVWAGDLVTRKRILKVWLFNPFTLILIYVFSNFDVLVAGLTVASLIFVRKEQWVLASLMLGVGAAFKAYPLLLLPWVVMAASKLKDRILSVVVGLGVVGLTIAPFITSSAFRESALVSGLTTRLFYPSAPIGFGEFLMPAMIGFGVILFAGMLGKLTPLRIVVLWSAVLLTMLGGIHYHISWLLWVAPFLALGVGLNPRLKWPVIWLAVIAMLIPFLYNDKSMNWATLAVIDPIFTTLPTPYLIVERVYDPAVVMGVLHSLLLGGSIVVSWMWWKESNES